MRQEGTHKASAAAWPVRAAAAVAPVLQSAIWAAEAWHLSFNCWQMKLVMTAMPSADPSACMRNMREPIRLYLKYHSRLNEDSSAGSKAAVLRPSNPSLKTTTQQPVKSGSRVFRTYAKMMAGLPQDPNVAAARGLGGMERGIFRAETADRAARDAINTEERMTNG